MHHTSAGLLEFEDLRALVGRYLGSAMGREELARVAPDTRRDSIDQMHAHNAEAVEYLQSAAKPQTAARGTATRLRFTDLPDCRLSIQKLRIEGTALEGKEIFDLIVLLDRASDSRLLLETCGGRFPLLAAMGRSIADMRPVLQHLSNRILPDGSVADHASVALNRIRRGIERQKQNIQASLERFLRAHRTDGVLQEDFVTLRNDRYVVPIVAGQQVRAQGVIHGSSGSGHTLFVEPLDTIEMNNELVRLVEEELREIYRILKEMTDRLRSQWPAIAAAVETLGRLDLLFAKANFAMEFDCVIPGFSKPDAPRLHVEGARHPLLEDVLRRQRKPIVPVSFTLDASRRTLLLSGPNTGGKTVTLKTVGLLALMAQSGIPVPAREAEFPVFDSVLADLGDNQSIAESLSSFSSHIRRMEEILTTVTPDSLVLLDELGRATDPEEGGALGVAIVDQLGKWKAFTLASTHLLALKIYGGSREGVVNGSMGFDRDTLAPTFQLRLGSPGESAGLAIASRLGMPPDLIAKAREALSSHQRALTDFLEQLQKRIAEASEEKQHYQDERRALEAREKALAQEWQQRETAKLKELERRSEELMRQFEERSQQTIESIYQTAQQKKAAEVSQRKASKAMREFREEFQATVLAANDPARQGAAPRLKIEEGVRVRLKNVREPARVKRKLTGDRLEVEAGFLKLQVSIDDVVEVLPETGGGSRLPSGVTLQTSGPRWDFSYREINIIGKHVEEALEELDKFLDQAAMADVQQVRVVHGHGMGVLKKAVAEFLSRHPHVARFHGASQSEGGAGATVVELREA
ncbi:MAG: Smr/MutS family protein [Acidobacteria bacterium]|nr:Smr/MutS family protein [Acidobacteriota bacterium]